MHLAALGLLVAASAGWADITVSPSRGDRIFSAWQQSVAGLDRPSERTVETLRRYELEGRLRRDPDGVIARLEAIAAKSPEPELVYALAELSWIEGRRVEGRRMERRRGAAALDRYVDTVAYAWDYLFDPELAGGRQPSDPRFRLACDLYNGGLDRLIRAAKTKDRIQPGDTIVLKIHGREQALRVNLTNCPWSPRDVEELTLASDFEVSGLDSRSRYQYGLGVPLIGVRRAEQAGKGDDRFYPPEMAFPLTAILRPNSRLRETDAEVERECTLDLVDPVLYRSVRDSAGHDALLLEADVTTPLAYMWSRTDLSRYRWTGLLRPGEAAGRAGLMLLRPYEPDKIPVVMVHGLASSPLAWIPMLNELLRDPNIQRRYQFLLYVYPTGVPVPIAAAGLRDALLEAQKSFDVAGTTTPEYEFRRMVLLGHSMGGLLSHSMAVNSDNRYWELLSDRPFDEIEGPPEVLAELRHYNFFDALPFIRRVVFLATPHRGSELSRRVVGRVSSSLIAEPDHYTKLLNVVLKENPDAFDRRRFRHLPTSIDTLEPDAPVLRALLAMKPGRDVTFHSIVGNIRPGPLAHATDGVVAYSSAHLDGVASEKVVRSDHGVQKDPAAILEVRRILLEHLVDAPAARMAGPDNPGVPR
jgi:pimeloyl-ACP methyl ester carboxylesterase